LIDVLTDAININHIRRVGPPQDFEAQAAGSGADRRQVPPKDEVASERQNARFY
jgi:hypothetical protein